MGWPAWVGLGVLAYAVVVVPLCIAVGHHLRHVRRHYPRAHANGQGMNPKR